MVNTGFTIDEDLLDDFDEVIWQKEVNGDLPRDTPRSKVLQHLVQEYVDENRELLDGTESGKRTPANTVLAD